MDEKFLETADALFQAEIAAGIERASKPTPRPHDFDGSCMECGGHIAEGRLALGKYNCVECQNALELKTRRR